MSLSHDEHQPTIHRWLIVCMLMGFTFLGHFNRVSISVAGNERFIGPNGMSNEQMGMVYSAFLLVYTICMLPGGWVIDRIGPRLALTGMGLGMGFCVILTGALGWLALPIVSLWLPLLAIRGCAGVVSVPLHPGAARSVSLWVPLADRATANGLVTAGALVGIALTYPLFGMLMDWLDWPLAFVVCGATMMLFALVWWRLAADPPAERGLNVTPGQVIARTRTSSAEVFELLRNRSLVLLTLSYAMLSYFQYLFFYWIEHYFEKELHLPVTASRRAAFTVTMAMAFGMAFGGYGTDYLCRRFGRRQGCRAMALTGMGLSALFGWQGVSAQDPSHVVVLFALALGSLGLCEGIFWTTAPVLGVRNGGLACAFLNTIGNAGGLLAPVLTPWIGEQYGWTAAIAVACLVCAAGALLWLVIDTQPADRC
ncbi:MAG: MFS transporter [Planctomycetes bacterium]|nr:MFS transporter [Planctomycetota bacterium]